MGGWVEVCASAQLGRLPRRVEVDGREVVLWRVPDGGVAALDDRCAHQWVRLSLGTPLDDGCLVCPSHGWTFGPDGRNVLQPGGPGVAAHDVEDDGEVVRVRLRP